MTKDSLISEINIGIIGHVDHGKTTLVKALSGQWTDTHSEEIKRGITIRIGYADFTIRKCSCDGPNQYTTNEKCLKCGEAKISRTISLVDAPGHETLMANVLSGAAIMDGALLIIAANEKCPQPQTKEHLTVLNVVGIENIILVQNKIDAVSQERAAEHFKEIKEFVKGTVAEKAPIVPISAIQGINIDVLLQTIEEKIKTPKRDEKETAEMMVIRSFDINKPGTPIKKLKGGILGGSLTTGLLKKGDQVEIKPGIKTEKNKWRTVTTTVENIRRGNSNVENATPGGLLAIETALDPSLTKSDALSGQMLGVIGTLPESLSSMNFKFYPVEREQLGNKANIREGEQLMLNIGTAKTAGMVSKIGKINTINLAIPVCAKKNQKFAVSKILEKRWRLIGYGVVQVE